MPPTLCAENGTPRVARRAVEALAQRARGRAERVVEARRLHELQRREARGDRDRIARERARLVHRARAARARCMMSRRPPNAPTGMPPPITLPSVVRSGVMP